MFTLHTTCRACGLGNQIPTLKQTASGGPALNHDSLRSVVDLGIQPLANDFCAAAQPRAGYAPLRVLYCPRCTLAQLSVVVDPAVLYRHYSYVTSPSRTMLEHFAKLASDIKAETDGRYLLEIGSNDGALLLAFGKVGFEECIGVDPAANLCELARKNGCTVVNQFFTQQVAREISASYRPDVILARHVFCHIDNWKDFVAGLQELIGPDTLVCLEVPYAGDLLRRGEFDTIYHEHLSFLTITSIEHLLRDSGLHLHRIIEYPIHGGAVLLMLRSDQHGKPASPSVGDYLIHERTTMNEDAWIRLGINARNNIDVLRAYVRNLRDNGKRVAGLGASAKSTVWINACSFTRKEIDYIADTTTLKQYKTSPGSDIPIVDEGAIVRDLPDYVICFAWNFKEEILQKFEGIRKQGVKFVFPSPTIEVV